jgi:hypothetical protein
MSRKTRELGIELELKHGAGKGARRQDVPQTEGRAFVFTSKKAPNSL